MLCADAKVLMIQAYVYVFQSKDLSFRVRLFDGIPPSHVTTTTQSWLSVVFLKLCLCA